MRTRLTTLLVALTLAVPLTLTVAARAAPITNDGFQHTWARTDQPVAAGRVSRTWMWGPEANTEVLPEPYEYSPGGLRQVQYFDKTRMEINDPNGDPSSPWYVTNGLLVSELITGRVQFGYDTFENHSPAEINIAGDAEDSNGPTYATFNALLDDRPFADDTVLTARVDRAGNVTSDASLATWNVRAGPLVPETQHRVASVFWSFLHSSGEVFLDGQYSDARLFDPWFYASGYPISEAYWTTVMVGGTPHDVLVQAFERRVLTYTPQNPPGWQVEAGNVGQHYHHWRYEVLTGDEPFDVTITDCSDLAAVATTLEAGGRIRLACGEVKLDFGRSIMIDQDMTIDGGGVTTLSGGGTHRVLALTGSGVGMVVMLRGLTIADGYAAGDYPASSGGGIYIDTADTFVRLHLEDATLRDNTAIEDGGAVSSDSSKGNVTLTAANVTFSGNTAASGGAIHDHRFFDGDTLTASSVTFSGNTATEYGGAVDLSSSKGRMSFSATDTTFSDNVASAGGAVSMNRTVMTATNVTFNENSANNGGALYLTASMGGGWLTATSTTFSGNRATAGSGGAIHSDISYGSADVRIRDVTFSGNTATESGGAVANVVEQSGSASVDAVNTTFSNNAAHAGGAVYNATYGGSGAEFTATSVTFSHNAADAGGAVYNEARGASATFGATATTFSDNTAASGGAVYSTGEGAGIAQSSFNSVILKRGATGANCGLGDAPAPVSNGYNLADDDSCALTRESDLENTDPLLAPLADNGGPTQTHALLPGSPAIDSGDPATCPDTDQRGVSRPQDGDGDGVAVCDRGAVEMTTP